MSRNNISAEHFKIGVGTVIEDSASIRGVSGKARNIRIGDHCYIGTNVQIMCDDFELGDYCKIHHDTNIYGDMPCRIGHNAWIGQFCIIDSLGGVVIGNNCGIGAGSQLWSHIKYGDTLEGNRFNSRSSLQIGHDVWFVGHCIVSPVVAADRSMAMAGSVVTKDMAYNKVYAGVPAKDISSRIGPQFSEVSTDAKFELMLQYLKELDPDIDDIKIVRDISEFKNDGISYFSVSTRQYIKTNSENEVRFMKFLLPEKAKFVPFKL